MLTSGFKTAYFNPGGGNAMYRRIKKIISITRPFIKKLSEDNVYAIAGQSTFYFILASVPLMMFAVSILQNLHIPQETLEQFIGMILNERATDYLSSFLSNAYADSSGISTVKPYPFPGRGKGRNTLYIG